MPEVINSLEPEKLIQPYHRVSGVESEIPLGEVQASHDVKVRRADAELPICLADSRDMRRLETFASEAVIVFGENEVGAHFKRVHAVTSWSQHQLSLFRSQANAHRPLQATGYIRKIGKRRWVWRLLGC